MPYLLPSEFRDDVLAWYTRGLTLTDAEAPTDELTAAIASMSERFDTATGDHFEPPNPDNDITLDLSGDGDTRQRGVSSRLILPKRVRSVTSVSTRDAAGALTLEAATSYRVASSLNAAGTDFSEDGAGDYIEIIQDKVLSTGLGYWPPGTDTVRVVGKFDWAVTPGDVKRAVALLVADLFKPVGDNIRAATTWRTVGGTIYEGTTEESPTGIGEVDEIVARYRRSDVPGF